MTVWREIASSNPARRQHESLEYFALRHARLVSSTALAFGLAGTITSFIVVCIPGAVNAPWLTELLLLHVLLGAALVWTWQRPDLLRQSTLFGTGLATILACAAAVPSSGINYSLGASICMVAGWSVGSLAVALTATRGALLFLGGVFLAIIAAVAGLGAWLGLQPGQLIGLFSLVVTLWALCAMFGIWLRSSMSRVSRRIVSIGRAHTIERRASETEAQRLRDARLLHDTALATLTLLAHSGVGVDEASLRSQAASDRELLERLRLGESPKPRSSGEYNLTNTAELQLGGTLENVKNRFNGTDLSVQWHGSGQLGLEPEKLDAFIYALVECIENVRRHAQVDEAHVTLSDDGAMVRGVVTDAGVGFDPAAVSSQRLGFRQSVVARVEDIGGTVRVFSAPGAGTTVVLEVAK
ncbi:Signal transduction histidine kinase [Paramicrobacterium humi]|uniref:Signal transduction histidine kinase n=1 Tax=Paramicrobacterium humi TaxID=640635 RepID=A0A1H4P6Q2_9MICO|nr:ATP-binding protein [Microbacterium humi]SEC03146.1 Signal transduction histidine kinase [Microbacterium humi]